MVVANQAVANARTTYEALANSALQGARASGVWKAIARRIDTSGVAHQLTLPGATPTWAELTDERDMGGFRKYTKTIPLKTYHKTIKLKRTDVEQDADGSTAMALEQFVGADVEAVWDKLVIDALVSNPTGVDGVSIVNDTHPFGSVTTWDNRTTTALSFAAFNTERARMRALKDEFGEPLNLEPRILLVHPDEEELALQIAQSDQKPVSVSTTGTINNGTVGAATIANIFRGNVDVIVSPRWTSGDWVIIDPRYLPLALCVFKDPTIIIVDDMTAAERVKHDDFIYGVEVDATADGAQPWGIAGKIS